MSLGPSLIVPVVLWGRHPPTHRVTCVYLTPDRRTLVTGCQDGHIVTWNVHPATLEVNPYMMLVGHTASVTNLSDGLLNTSHKYLVSAASNGEMCVWDLQEGQCLETNKLSFVHRQIEAYQPAHASDVLLFCCGEYADIAVLHPLTLQLVYWLSSKLSSNWVTSLHVFRPHGVADDIVMAVNSDSVVKIWALGAGDVRTPADTLYENESKRIRTAGVHYLRCCAHNPRTVLLVADHAWEIYDASDVSLLCRCAAAAAERWQRGQFLSTDQVIVWADSGRGYIYQLPPNSIAGHDEFHTRDADEPFLYCALSSPGQQELYSPPVSLQVDLQPDSGGGGGGGPLLVRGDCLGQVAVWRLPRATGAQLSQLRAAQNHYQPPEMPPTVLWSLEKAWKSMRAPPVGILDQLESEAGGGCAPRLTCSVYLPLLEGRLVCGRQDGTIIIVSATHTAMLHLLHGRHQACDNWPVHQILSGHRGAVTALLFPALSSGRFSGAQLVSGGRDFSVCLWDLCSGSLLHRFVVQAGVITQLHVPPDTVLPRVQQCICSVAADHSVALLSLQERRCLLLASRHLFPVASVKWRPLDDFMMVATEDGAVSVWQMETGHLDRVVHGTTAQEVLSACDENVTVAATSGDAGGMANPAVHFFRGLRHRNLSAIRHAAKRGLQQIQNTLGAGHGPDDPERRRSQALAVQSLRACPTDPDGHVLFFDVESLIGLLARVKEGAETVGGIIQARSGAGPRASDAGQQRSEEDGEGGRGRVPPLQTESQTMEICQVLLSLIHAWGVDPDVDRVCENRLGMLRPKHPVCFGLISRHGFVSLLLPTFLGASALAAPLAERTVTFTRRTHWELSCALTTNHLLAMIAIADTLMSMDHTSFVPEAERRKRFQKQLTRTLKQAGQANGGTAGAGATNGATDGLADMRANFWVQVREGWSQLATLHCVQFPDRLEAAGVALKKPLVEMLARRWQDGCVEIRQAAQSLLLAELHRLSPRALKALVDWWAPLLPVYGDQQPAAAPAAAAAAANHTDHGGGGGGADAPAEPETEDFGDEHIEEDAARRAAASEAEARRKQATAIILLGVIGAQFGQEAGRSGGVEGFGLGPLALHTSQALAHLLLAPASARLPAHTPLRRAAIDLMGRGFTQWEPHVDASKVLLAMLELSCDADTLAPSLSYGLPLAAAADTARTARHALALIAVARPQVFVTTMAREVSRYNSLQQNAQSINVVVHHTVLLRARPELLRVLELLIDKCHQPLVQFLIELTDILLHCLDPSHLRQRPLQEVFPAVARFHQVTHCCSGRRVAVGTATGTLAIYDLRMNNKSQLHAHSKAITACAFSPDGKFLASYSTAESKISFWQTSTGMFGLGNAQTRCVKTYSTPPLPEIVRLNAPRPPQLVWSSHKTVTALLSDGTEQRYNV